MDTISFVSGHDRSWVQPCSVSWPPAGNIELIASENIVSPAVMAASGSVLTNKYAEGYPGHRYYGGCRFVDQVEQIAIDRACKLFGANMPTCSPVRRTGQPGPLLCPAQPGRYRHGHGSFSQGGHLTHGSPANMSGELQLCLLRRFCGTAALITMPWPSRLPKVRPKLRTVRQASAYPRAIDFEKAGRIAHGYGAMLMVDMAHIA